VQNHEYRFSFNAGFFPNLHCLKFLPFQPPLHPASSDRALHARRRARKPHIMPARAKRKRTGNAVASRTSKNNLACLRGAVSGGAEEMIFFCGPVRAVAQACHSACQCECICRLSMCTYARFTRTCRQACWLFSDHLRMQSTTALTNRRGCWNCEERKEASLQPAGSFNGVQKRGAFCDPCVVAQACN